MDTKNNPPQAQTLIGKLLDDFSALPVLWGLNEPGALVRHGDIFRIIVDAGKAFAAAPAPAQQPDAPSVYEAALRKLCDQLDGMKFTMFNMPGTGQNYSYWLREDASFYVEEARKVLDAPASSKPAGVVLTDEQIEDAIVKEVHEAILDACKGADTYMAALIGARKIAALKGIASSEAREEKGQQ